MTLLRILDRTLSFDRFGHLGKTRLLLPNHMRHYALDMLRIVTARQFEPGLVYELVVFLDTFFSFAIEAANRAIKVTSYLFQSLNRNQIRKKRVKPLGFVLLLKFPVVVRSFVLYSVQLHFEL